MPREDYLQHRFEAETGVFARQSESMIGSEGLCGIYHLEQTDGELTTVFPRSSSKKLSALDE